MNELATAAIPDEGIWRLGRSPDPLLWTRPQDPVNTNDGPGVGNRFDSFHANFATLYFATTPEPCYAETLSRFRVSEKLGDLVRNEWQTAGFMQTGAIPTDWRDSRLLVRARIVGALPFVDIAHPDTLVALTRDVRISSWLDSFGIRDTDLATLTAQDRRVTRLIAQHVAEAADNEKLLYSGIRYVSRHGASYECWAVFEGCVLEEVERRPILVGDPDLGVVARRYGLTVH